MQFGQSQASVGREGTNRVRWPVSKEAAPTAINNVDLFFIPV